MCILAWICILAAPPPPPPPGPKGVRAQPGTPRDPKSHLFVTNWVAIQPFCTSEAGFDAEFRRGSRQIGPTPSISTFFLTFFGPKMPKIEFGAKKNAPARNAAVPSNLGWKKHPLGALGGPRGPWGAPYLPLFGAAGKHLRCSLHSFGQLWDRAKGSLGGSV